MASGKKEIVFHDLYHTWAWGRAAWEGTAAIGQVGGGATVDPAVGGEFPREDNNTIRIYIWAAEGFRVEGSV